MNSIIILSIIFLILTIQAFGDPCDDPNGFEVDVNYIIDILCCENQEITLKHEPLITDDTENIKEILFDSCHFPQDMTLFKFLTEIKLANTSRNVLTIHNPKFLTAKQLDGMTELGVTSLVIEIWDKNEISRDILSSMLALTKLAVFVESATRLPDVTPLKDLEILMIRIRNDEPGNKTLFKQFLPNILQNTSNFKVLAISTPFKDDWYQILTDHHFVNQSGMEVLHLESLGINDISTKAFINMSNLTRISLGENQLEKFNLQYLPSSSLQFLNLSHNYLTECHFTKPFPQLTELNLNQNRIKSFILDLNYTLKGLHILLLSNNFLKVLEIIPHPNHQLTYLDLTGNDLRDPSVWYWSHMNRNKTHVILDGNHPVCDCATRDKLLAMNVEPKSNVDEKTESRPFIKYCAPLPNQQIIILLKELQCSTTSDGKCIINLGYIINEDLLYQYAVSSTIINCTKSDNNTDLLFASIPDYGYRGYIIFQTIIIYTGNLRITSIGHLANRSYHAVHIYAEYCNIRSLSLENLPKRLKNLHLAGNGIRVIDVPVLETLKAMSTNMTLRGNPLICDCDRQPMFKALIAMKNLILDWDEVRCDDGGMFDPERELCVSWETILLSFGVVILAIITCLVGFYLRYTLEVQVYIYSRGWLPAVFKPEPDDQDYEYDVFVSYSDKDEEFVVFLLDFLENHVQPPFKVCHHHRDWIPGQRIDRQIITSIESSRKTIVILSRNFLASYWSNMEFRTAHYTMLKEKVPRLIMIIYGEIGPVSELEPEFRSYIKTTTYLASDDRWFKKKLTFALRKADVVYKIVENDTTTPQ